MRSAYPSSHSFFDATSDSIRAEDVAKCRSSASFSCLADLFTNPTCKSDLFPTVRTHVFPAEEEVQFPSKKKRECEERTSIWHEWGSGECQTENVAQESSGLLSELFRPSAIKSSELSSSSCSSSFPNLGSANISLLPEEFAFPARKKREEGSSWREERTSWQDWTMSGSPSERMPSGVSTPVGSIAGVSSSKQSSDHSNLLSISKSGVFSTLGAPARSSEELSFPARKKREERSFWQEPTMDGVPSSNRKSGSAVIETTSGGVGSLADLYMKKSGTKCSSLFSKGALNSSEEVIFPKRKNRADRNEWRDWRNTGYSEWEDEVDPGSPNPDALIFGSPSNPEHEVLASSRTKSSIDEGAIRFRGDQLMSDSVNGKSLQSRVCTLSSTGLTADAISSGHSTISDETPVFSNDGGCLADNAEKSTFLDDCSVHSAAAEIRGFSDASLQEERSTDGGEQSANNGDISTETDEQFYPLLRFRSCKRGHYDQGIRQTIRQTGKYPPPLVSLTTQGSSRVPYHMPWVQLQPIRSEGRFMLQEVNVTQPVVFQPIRSEGRLVLQLIGQNSKHIGEDEKTFSTPDSKHIIKEVEKTFRTLDSKRSEKGEKIFSTPDGAKVGPGVVSTEKLMAPVVDVKEKPAAEATEKRKLLEPLCAPLGETEIFLKPSNICESLRKSRETERLSPDTTLHEGGSETLNANCHVLSRTLSFRNGLSGLPFSSVDGETALTRSRSFRNSPPCDFATSEEERKEGLRDSVRNRVEESPYSVGKGGRESSLHLTSANSFLWSVRRRPGKPGEPDPRLSSYTPAVVAPSFSCADGMGKRHHEKRFWEQQPCVS